MSEEGKFWCNIWSIIIVMIIVVTALLIANSTYKASLLAEMIEHGANPLDASCALYGSPADEGSSCLLRMERK